MNSMTYNGLAISVANQKKSEIDFLTNEIDSAQYAVDQLQCVVTSLSTKSGEFSGFLTEAQTNKDNALSYLNTANDLINQAKALRHSANIARTQSAEAQKSLSSTAEQMSCVVNKLILSTQVIDKIAQLVNGQKLQNAIIPNELITIAAKATTDGNDAVAKTLTALNSCYAAEATLIESQNITAFEYEEAQQLVTRLTKDAAERNHSLDPDSFVLGLGPNATGLLALLQNSYNTAIETYNLALRANNTVTSQLDFAQSQLTGATTRLNSLKAGLAAAQAAAFAA